MEMKIRKYSTTLLAYTLHTRGNSNGEYYRGYSTYYQTKFYNKLYNNI